MTDITSIRPRNGKPAECYWRIREWCEANGFSFSDVINAILIPMAYYLENFCKIEEDKNMAIVDLNIGEVPIFHTRNDSIIPLDGKASLRLEEIREHVERWKKQNDTKPSAIDLLISQHGIYNPKK